MSEKLTARQKKFCDEYLIDLNATQAAIRAGYSKKSANRQGTENLSKPVISAYVKAAIDERAEKTKLTADWVLEKLKKNAEICLNESYVDVTSVDSLGQAQTVKTKKHDAGGANKALELIGKHLDIFNRSDDLDDDIEFKVIYTHKEEK